MREVVDAKWLSRENIHEDAVGDFASSLGCWLRNAGRSIPCLRVRPETLYGITKPSQHEANGSEAQERQRCSVELLPIFGEPAAAVEPQDGAFNDPTTWEHHKLVSGLIGSLDDFGFDLR